MIEQGSHDGLKEAQDQADVKARYQAVLNALEQQY
jgi:hypothetical protein